MTVPHAATANTASGFAKVDVQAGTIHGGVNYYQVPRDASPQDKYRIALAHLEGGLPTTARKLMEEVVFDIPDSGEVWFHWLLAFFSGRALGELSAEDHGRLHVVLQEIAGIHLGCWSSGIDLICRLVATIRSRDEDPSAVVRKFDALDPAQRTKILRHLERVLAGPLKDGLWRRDADRAVGNQQADGRADRVWKFFEPEPARPRTRPVRPAETSPAHQMQAVLATALFLTAVGTIGWLVLQRADRPALVAGLIGLLGAGLALGNGAEWRFRHERLRTKEREARGHGPGAGAAPSGGFADEVDRLYRRYCVKYAPPGTDRDAWLIATAGIRRNLRNELVEVYRESRTTADAVRWLIRFQMQEVRKQWPQGTVYDHRRRWRTPWPVKAATVVGLAALGAGAVWAVLAAVQVRGLTAAGAALLAVPAACVAGTAWLQIVIEGKRVTADQVERDDRMARYRFGYQRWRRRLDDRPDDVEMATWLDCDRRIVMDHAMRAYQLRWSEVRAYASLEAPGAGSRKARVPNGPWRYSRYELLLFLLTPDGIRQVTVELDFATATFHTWQRTNYRFDAVAAVRVIEHDDGTREFQLSLVNGDDIRVEATQAGPAGAEDDSGILVDGALDASGLRTALFVLEGVAADGRAWWASEAYRRAG